MLSLTAQPRAFALKTSGRVAGRRSLVVSASNGHINPEIQKDVDKVVHTVAVPTDLGGKPQVAYCRCWRSATFPLCNGAHVKHNKETGDNVGPLLVKASQ